MMRLYNGIHLLLIASVSQITVSQSTGGSCTPVTGVSFSNYGFPDASNPTNFSCTGNQPNGPGVPTPLGTGAPGSPYAAALSDTATAFRKCETVYIPYFRKYFKFVDVCAACRKCKRSISYLDQDEAKSRMDTDITKRNRPSKR